MHKKFTLQYFFKKIFGEVINGDYENEESFNYSITLNINYYIKC